jgi:hypothetical protein
MNEELKDTIENITEVLEDVATEPSGNVIGKVVGAGVTLIVGAGAAVAIKKRNSIKAWNEKRLITKLEKRGYKVNVVMEEDEVVNSEEE